MTHFDLLLRFKNFAFSQNQALTWTGHNFIVIVSDWTVLEFSKCFDEFFSQKISSQIWEFVLDAHGAQVLVVATYLDILETRVANLGEKISKMYNKHFTTFIVDITDVFDQVKNWLIDSVSHIFVFGWKFFICLIIKTEIFSPPRPKRWRDLNLIRQNRIEYKTLLYTLYMYLEG